MSLRLVFLGTPAFAVPSLARLVDQGYEIAAVYTQPPRRAGRGMNVTASPVARFAHERGLPVRDPVSLKGPAEHQAFAALRADVAVVVAYGLILPRAVIEAPRLGCYNVHASLLPRWRGAAPIQRAIMAGDEVTGVSIMRVSEGLDEGPVCLAHPVPIAPGMSAGELHDKLAALGAELIVQAMVGLATGHLRCTAQHPEGVTYARKIDKSETPIDFSKAAPAVVNHMHALSPHPGAWFVLPGGGPGEVRIKVLKAEPAKGTGTPGTTLDEALTIACGEGAVRPLIVQREGGSAVDLAAFLRGRPVPAGTRLA